jgi:AraC family transcriptional regulator, melibiose operon regulatory protein
MSRGDDAEPKAGRDGKTALMKLAVQADPRPSHGFGAGMGDRKPMRSVHAHGDLEINYVFSGSIRYFLADHYIALVAGSLAAFWAAAPHQVVACSPNTEYMWLSVPLSTLLRWDLGPTFLRGVLSGEVYLEGTSPEWDAELTRRWIDDLLSDEPFRIRTVELEVEARLRRLLMSNRKDEHAPANRKVRERFEAIAAFLDIHYREHISIEDIGHAVDLHPNYAMSLFRRECGITIWQYLMRRRLAQAQALLLSSDMSVLAVALESGFGSVPRFYAAFSRECGMSPGDFRRRA